MLLRLSRSTFLVVYVLSHALEVVKINILGGVCAEPKEVCVLRGSRSLLWWCVYVIWI